MKLKPETIKTIIGLLFISIGLIIFFIYQNNAITITNYRYTSPKLPEGLNGYKIVQVSDLHNKDFKGRLVEKIKKANPNIIVITGDLIDRRNTKIKLAVDFIERIVDIGPVYYVTGNHEQLSSKYGILKKELERLNVEIIDNSYTILNHKGYEMGLMGIGDPAIYQKEKPYWWQDSSQYVKNSLEKLLENSITDFNILLSHRPEQFHVYKDMDLDLVFTGHAHGGQIRLPLIGGIFAPSQGFFPKYTSGIHSKGGTSMVVSRGLGNSIFPLRIFNPPDLVVVTFSS